MDNPWTKGVWKFELTLQYVLHCEGQLVLHVGQNMGINVQGDGGAGMAVGFLFENVELSLERWTVIAGISGFDD